MVAAQPTLMESTATRESPPVRLNRDELLRSIIDLNPTATSEFLREFSDRSLRRYLDHLALTTGPRGRETRWLRDDHEPAIVARDNLD